MDIQEQMNQNNLQISGYKAPLRRSSRLSTISQSSNSTKRKGGGGGEGKQFKQKRNRKKRKNKEGECGDDCMESICVCCISEEKLTYSDDAIPIYTVQIKDFHHKMKNWPAGKCILTQEFDVQDVRLHLSIYPNGGRDEGNVSVYIANCMSKQIYLHYTIQIGDHKEVEIEQDWLPPKDGRGWPYCCDHVLIYPAYRPDEELKVTFKIVNLTTDMVVWDLFNETKDLLNETNSKLKESKANQDFTNRKLASMESKLVELRNLSIKKVKKPPCPICFEEMSYNTKIAQCINGHHLCWSCKEKMEKKECPSCGQPVEGRAFGMESYLRSIFGAP